MYYVEVCLFYNTVLYLMNLILMCKKFNNKNYSMIFIKLHLLKSVAIIFIFKNCTLIIKGNKSLELII